MKQAITIIILLIMVIPSISSLATAETNDQWEIDLETYIADEEIFSTVEYEDEVLAFSNDDGSINYWTMEDRETMIKTGTTATSFTTDDSMIIFQEGNEYQMIANQTSIDDPEWDFFTDFSGGEPDLDVYTNGGDLYYDAVVGGVGGYMFDDADYYGYELEESYEVSKDQEGLLMHFKIEDGSKPFTGGLYDSTNSQIVCGFRYQPTASYIRLYAWQRTNYVNWVRTVIYRNDPWPHDDDGIIKLYLENGNLWVCWLDENGNPDPNLNYDDHTAYVSNTEKSNYGLIGLDIQDPDPYDSMNNRIGMGISTGDGSGIGWITEMGIAETTWEFPKKQMVLRTTGDPRDLEKPSTNLDVYGEPLDIIKIDDIYYLYVDDYFDGIQIYTSTDLVEWEWINTIFDELTYEIMDLSVMKIMEYQFITLLEWDSIRGISFIINYRSEDDPTFATYINNSLIASISGLAERIHFHRDNVEGNSFDSTTDQLWGFLSDSIGNTYSIYNLNAVTSFGNILMERIGGETVMMVVFIIGVGVIAGIVVAAKRIIH